MAAILATTAACVATPAGSRCPGIGGGVEVLADALPVAADHQDQLELRSCGCFPSESEISLAPNEWLRDLKMAALLAGEARYGNWLVGTDFIYMRLGDSGSKTKARKPRPRSGPGY